MAVSERVQRQLRKKYGWALPKSIDETGFAILLEQEKEKATRKKARLAALRELKTRSKPGR